MGQTIKCNFGLGFEVINHMEEESDFENFVNEAIAVSDYLLILTYNYDTERRFFVTLFNPFDNGYDLTSKAKELKDFLTNSFIEFYGEFGLVGGLRSY